ncbi:MAG: hypothetical protein ACI9MR_004442 [Myxococcota bacterium]|jgi:hypothetical protein
MKYLSLMWLCWAACGSDGPIPARPASPDERAYAIRQITTFGDDEVNVVARALSDAEPDVVEAAIVTLSACLHSRRQAYEDWASCDGCVSRPIVERLEWRVRGNLVSNSNRTFYAMTRALGLLLRMNTSDSRAALTRLLGVAAEIPNIAERRWYQPLDALVLAIYNRGTVHAWPLVGHPNPRVNDVLAALYDVMKAR